MAGTVKGSSRRSDGGPAKLHLAELLDFRPDQGIIRLHEQRVVILSAAAMRSMASMPRLLPITEPDRWSRSTAAMYSKQLVSNWRG